MKKIFLPFLFCISMILSSCKIHFGDESINVHWLVIVIPAFVILLCVGLSLSKKKFYCPSCNKTFYVKWWKCIFTTHVNDERALKCPHCKKINACYPSSNQDKEEK